MIPSLSSFGNSSGNSYIPCLLLVITLRCTCGEKKIAKVTQFSKYYAHGCLQNFILRFVSLPTVPIAIVIFWLEFA